MNILIKGMEMPKSCAECRLTDGVICYGTADENDDYILGEETYAIQRARFCPLIEMDDTEWEWCHDCKEYDQEAHCCHRWTKVIRQTVAELEERYGERRNDEGAI